MSQRRIKAKKVPRSNRNQKKSSSTWPWKLIVLIVIVLFVIGEGLYWGWGVTQSFSSESAISDVLATIPKISTPIATLTVTPSEPLLQAVPVDEANRQVLATVQRWTSTQMVGIDCVATVCNQEVGLSLTLLRSEVIEDLVQQEFAGRDDVALAEFEQRVQEVRQRLNVEAQLPFMLAISTPEGPTLPVRSEISFGSIEKQLALESSNQESVLPIVVDQSFEVPFLSFLEQPLRGYVFFPSKNESGQLILSEKTSSLAAQLPISSDLRSNRSVVSWSFDLVSSNRPVPLAPTPTPDPNAPPSEDSLVDSDVIIAIVELLAELADEK